MGGKSERKSFFDAAEAQRFAKHQAEQLSAGHIHTPGLSPAEVETFREAKRHLATLCIPLHVAAQEYASAVTKLGCTGMLQQAVDFFLQNTAPLGMEKNVQQILEEFLKHKARDGVSQRYLEDCRNRIGRFAKDFKTPIALIRSREIGDWLYKLKCGPRSRNNYRNLIVTLFSFARKRGYLHEERPNPALMVDLAKEKSAPISIFTPKEIAELFAVATPEERIAIAIGAFAGIRQAEILRLRWEHFNWEEHVIDLGSDMTKTASRRLVPILPALDSWLMPLRKEKGRIFQFTDDTGFHRIYSRMVKSVNQLRPDGQKDFVWKRNGLRHSYASYRLALIEDAAKVSLEMGNSPQKVFSNYRKVVTKSQAIAWFAVMPSTPENVVPIIAA